MPTDKRILVIDDIRKFRFDCVYARTCEEAIEELGNNKYDMVWFDYDMGRQFGRFEIYDTVLPVISWLEESIYYGKKPDFVAVIHTSNPAGRKILNAVLNRHYKVINVDAHEYTTSQSEWENA